MNTKELYYFKTVYEKKSITGAAKKHFITPQGLSKTIKNLEIELGTMLFNRTQKGMEPTLSADILYKKVESIIEQLNQIEQEIKALETSGKSIRIGCAIGVLDVLPVQLIFDFIKDHPDIKVQWCECSNQEIKEQLEEGALDFGFIVGEYKNQRMQVRKITSRQVLLLVYEGHEFYQLEKIAIPMLRDEKVVTMNEQYNMYHDFMKECLKCDFVPNIVGKTADSGFLYRLCRQKVGLAVETDFSIEDMRLEGVRAIPFQENLRWNVCCAYRKEKESYSVVKLFYTYLESYMKN